MSLVFPIVRPVQCHRRPAFSSHHVREGMRVPDTGPGTWHRERTGRDSGTESGRNVCQQDKREFILRRTINLYAITVTNHAPRSRNRYPSVCLPVWINKNDPDTCIFAYCLHSAGQRQLRCVQFKNLNTDRGRPRNSPPNSKTDPPTGAGTTKKRTVHPELAYLFEIAPI